jgi:hypothetical protein
MFIVPPSPYEGIVPLGSVKAPSVYVRAGCPGVGSWHNPKPLRKKSSVNNGLNRIVTNYCIVIL